MTGNRQHRKNERKGSISVRDINGNRIAELPIPMAEALARDHSEYCEGVYSPGGALSYVRVYRSARPSGIMHALRGVSPQNVRKPAQAGLAQPA